jgi:cold shock CspA family protein
MTFGRVIRFDEARGYGFITRMEGGADVFFHANDVLTNERELPPGTEVSFEIFASDRGLRARSVKVIGDGETSARLAASQRCSGTPGAPLAERQYLGEIRAAISAEIADLAPEQASSLARRLVDVARRQGWLGS